MTVETALESLSPQLLYEPLRRDGSNSMEAPAVMLSPTRAAKSCRRHWQQHPCERMGGEAGIQSLSSLQSSSPLIKVALGNT